MKSVVRNTLGLILSVALLVWALHNVEFALVVEHLRQSNPWYFALAVVLGTLIFPVRAWRWRIILDPVAYHLPFGPLWRATAIGFALNNTTPRLGEIARPYSLSRESPRVSFSAALASLVVDRLFDTFAIVTLLVVAMLSPAFPDAHLVAGRPIGSWLTGFVVLLLGGVAVLYAVVLFPSVMLAVYDWFVRVLARASARLARPRTRHAAVYGRLARLLSPRFAATGRAMLIAFSSGLVVLRQPGRFAAVYVWAMIHWLINALAYWVGFKAVGIAAPFSAALMLQGLVAIGVALPSVPGFFGVFEAIGQQGLGIYGVDAARATSWAIGYHILTFIPITAIGIYYFVRLGLNFRDLERTQGGAAASTGLADVDQGPVEAPPRAKVSAAPGERA